MPSTTLKLPNPTFLVGEEERMIDEKVLHAPSMPFLYEIVCPNCQQPAVRVSVRHGFRCTACEFNDPHHKTYRRLVKVPT